MTSIETGRSWSERLNPRNWTLTWKLVVVGLVPALLALALGVLRVSDQAGDAAELGRSTELLQVQEQVANAADAMRQERDEAGLFVAGGRAGDRGVLEIGFGQTDGAVEGMLGAVRSAGDLDPTTAFALQQTSSELGQLQLLRGDATDNAAVTYAQIDSRYTQTVDSIDVLDRALLRQLRTPGIAGLADALTAVTDASEQLAQQHTMLGAAIRTGALQPSDATSVSAAENRLASNFREYEVALTPAQLTRFGNFTDDAANQQRQRLATQILATPPNQAIPVPASEWDTAYNGSRAAADRASDLLRNELSTVSRAAEEQASNLAGVNSVVLMLGLMIGIAVAVLIARALIRSLRVLRTSALDVAERRLPLAVENMRSGNAPEATVEPVPLTGRDEVGQVARAFDAVHGQAIRLAADQAALQAGVSAMFVNLSRRSQALVERQLQLIEQLESNEQDADQLSNLFQLDHLATRMRRNSENLLVLAGTDLAKRNISPVPVVDVLRAAVSEVESYQRIVVQTPPTATIAGRSASDLVHLLAELLDNATNFSPPDSQVVMSTSRTSEGTLVMEIADNGVGMAEHELADANQRLSGPASVDVSASRRMGLFVIGRLAVRHGLGVHLSTSVGGQGTGLTASVTVPAQLIPSIEPVELSRTAGLPLVAGAAGARPGVPPQRGVNGAARPGGLSSLVAGADGPANPASVFEPPAGGDSQLFTPPPGANNGTPPSLPSRRPGSTLRPGGPPVPPEKGNGHEPSDRSADEAREVADRARRDQEEAARAAAARTEAPRLLDNRQDSLSNGNLFHRPEPSEPKASPDETAFGAGETARPETEWPQSERPQSEPERPTPNGAAPRGPAGLPGTTSESGTADASAPGATPAGLPRRTPRRPDQFGPATLGQQPNAFEPPPRKRAEPRPGTGHSAPEQQRGQEEPDQNQAGPDQPQAPAQSSQAQPETDGRATPADAAPARPEAPRPWPTAGPTGPTAPNQSQAGQSQTDPNRTEQSGSPSGLPKRTPGSNSDRMSGTTAAGAAAVAGAAAAAGAAADPKSDEKAAAERPATGADGKPTTGTTNTAATLSAAVTHPPTMPMPKVAPPAADTSAPPRTTPPAAGGPAQQRVTPPAADAPAQRPSPRPTPRPFAPPTRAPEPTAPPAAAQPTSARPTFAQPTFTQPADEGLFSPNVPVIAGPDRDAEIRQQAAFDLGETTPIFEEIASAWFRSNRPIPVNWQQEQNGAAPAAPEAPRQRPTPRPTDTPFAAPTPTPTPRPAAGPTPAPRPTPPPPTTEVPVTAANAASGAPVTGAPLANAGASNAAANPPADAEEDFASTADEGWRAASGAVTENPDDVTSAGLPKRRPRARLVPGSAGSAVLAPPVVTARSAENIRGRLASYQQGVRQGRESRMRGIEQHQQGTAAAANGGSGPANAGVNHDEESS